jgi:hypothetical protein
LGIKTDTKQMQRRPAVRSTTEAAACGLEARPDATSAGEQEYRSELAGGCSSCLAGICRRWRAALYVRRGGGGVVEPMQRHGSESGCAARVRAREAASGRSASVVKLLLAFACIRAQEWNWGRRFLQVGSMCQ